MGSIIADKYKEIKDILGAFYNKKVIKKESVKKETKYK